MNTIQRGCYCLKSFLVTWVGGSSSSASRGHTRPPCQSLLRKRRWGRRGGRRRAGREGWVRRQRACQEHWTLSMMGKDEASRRRQRTTGPPLSPPGTLTTTATRQSEMSFFAYPHWCLFYLSIYSTPPSSHPSFIVPISASLLLANLHIPQPAHRQSCTLSDKLDYNN